MSVRWSDVNCYNFYKKSVEHLTYASALVLSCDHLGQWGITSNIVTNIFVCCIIRAPSTSSSVVVQGIEYSTKSATFFLKFINLKNLEDEVLSFWHSQCGRSLALLVIRNGMLLVGGRREIRIIAIIISGNHPRWNSLMFKEHWKTLRVRSESL